MKFKEFWTKFPRWAKRTAGVAVAVSLVITILGTLVFGVTDWWNDQSFIVNIASSLVGALIGIPIAVIAIGWFTEFNANRMEVDSVRETTERAWSDFERSAARSAPTDVTEHLLDDALEAEKAFGELVDYLIGYQEMRQLPAREKRAYNFGPLFEGISSHHWDLTRSLIAVRKRMGLPDEHQRRWADLRLRWTFLSTEVRRLRYAQKLTWMPSEQELAIEAYIDAGSPLAQVSAQLDVYEHFDEIVARALLAAVADSLDPAEAARYGRSIRPETLSNACGLAAIRMNEFRAVVEAVESDNWRSPVTTK